MSTISYDGQSFIVDGRRVWLVSGAIHYPRTPRQLWRKRIRAAREAGLNCIETYAFWNVHEPQPGKFDFQGDRDLRTFIQMIGDEGMYCIFRPGPFICAEWDNGGLPAWLGRSEDIKLRQASAPFLQACARYLGAVFDQVRDLQITTPVHGRPTRASHMNLPGQPAGGYPGKHVTGSGAGPIILMQAENEWFCHNPDQAEAYLRQIVRYLRENGCEVPINVCNQLWQRVDGAIHTWNAVAHLPADLRQLAVIQPQAPRLVSEYWTGWFDVWGEKRGATGDAGAHLYRMAGILASGAQYNLYMFHGGTNFGFRGGRTVDGPARFVTTSYDYDAPLLEAGGRGAKYNATKRISTFASQFHHVLAHLEPARPHTAVAPSETDHPLSVVHQHGSQGDVVFVLRAEQDKTDHVDLMLPEGLTLPVAMGRDRAAWVLLHTNLGGVARLNYTNLRPWAFLERRMLVLFAPAGSEGLISINDVPLEMTVPQGVEPRVEKHENFTIVVLSDEQVDATYIYEHGLAVWSAGLDDQGQPLPVSARKRMVLVGLDGSVSNPQISVTRKPPAPKLAAWEYASVAQMLDGSSPAYEKIDGPASLESLQCDYGYGWYKFSIGKHKPGKVMSPGARDRLHVYHKGQLKQIIGTGPGAQTQPVDLSLADEAVVLVDNLGRFNFGQRLGEPKGIVDHFYTVRPIKLAKAKLVSERAPDPFVISGLVLGRRKGERPPSEALVWQLKPAGRRPIIIEVCDFPADAVLLINDQPVAIYSPRFTAGRLQYVLDPQNQAISSGRNQVKLGLYAPLEASVDPLKYVRAYQSTAAITARSQWAFAPWRVPDPDTFEKPSPDTAGRPGWFRTTFCTRATNVPLWVEPRSMTKGQIYLNGHNIGRFWMNTDQGKPVPPQRLYYLPQPWLRDDQPNELLIFDEHGSSPNKVRLLYNNMGAYGK